MYEQTLVFLSPLPWQCPHAPASGISCPSDMQPAHFVSQSWTWDVFFYWVIWVTLVLFFLPVGCSCFFRCMRVERRDTRSPLALCVGLAALVPGPGGGTLLNDWNHRALLSHLLQRLQDVLASSQASQGWRAHEPQGLLCVRSAVPAVRTVRDPASSTAQGRVTCQRQLASICLNT